MSIQEREGENKLAMCETKYVWVALPSDATAPFPPAGVIVPLSACVPSQYDFAGRWENISSSQTPHLLAEGYGVVGAVAFLGVPPYYYSFIP